MFAVLVRVSSDGLAAWQPDAGVLRIEEPGWTVLPRWRWQIHRRSAIRATQGLVTMEGLRVPMRLAWRPRAGRYELVPAPAPADAVEALVSDLASDLLGDVPLPCLEREQAAYQFCPRAWRQLVQGRLAERLQATPEDLQAHFQPEASGVRPDRLGELRERVPGRHAKVLLLGLDGFDWDLVLPWVRGGAMPNLARLLDAGTWGELDTIVPILSPLIWTSMTTGVSPEVHGILDFVERDPESGQLVPITGRSREVPALWNIASALGRSVGVVGWWATWPAEHVNGVMVSDRLYYTLVKQGPDPELAADAPGIVAPNRRAAEFAALRRRAIQETDWERLRSFLEVSRAEFEHAEAAGRGMDDPIDGLRRILASTRTYLEGGLLLAPGRPDLLMVYLEGTDTIGHLLARYVPPPVVPGVSAEQARRSEVAVSRYFRWVDKWLGRYLEAFPLDVYTWLVVSDHGFKWSDDRPRGEQRHSGRTAPLWHEDDAVFLLAGTEVEPRGRLDHSLSIYDVAPTVAGLLGLPRGENWVGQPFPGTPDVPVAAVDYQQVLPSAAFRAEPSDAAPQQQEFLAELQALGYLGRSEPAQPVREEARTLGALNNLGVLLLQEGRLEDSERVLRQAIESYPEGAFAHVNLRLLRLEQRQYEEANRELWRAIDKRWHDSHGLISGAARDYLEAGMPARAATLLEEATRRFPQDLNHWLQLLTVRTTAELCREGVQEARLAAERFPRSARVHGFHGLLAMCVGRADEARRAMRRSLEIDPNQAVLREALTGLPP